MNRRNFIQLSGASLASLLVSDFVKAENKKRYILQMPDEIKILSGDEYFSLETSDHHTWQYKDVIIELKNSDKSVFVFIQSPALSVKEVKLSWKYSISNRIKCFRGSLGTYLWRCELATTINAIKKITLVLY